MIVSRKSVISMCSAVVFGLASTMAIAQTAPDSMGAMHEGKDNMAMKGMDMKGMDKMPSMHTMPATVTSVDMKTGEVMAESEGMALHVHFPAASVADLKSGDKITLHLGFSKP